MRLDQWKLALEESNVLELDEHAEELQHVFDNISGVHHDPELLQVSRQVEFDIMSRLNVCRSCPRHWATDKCIPVIPTKQVDVIKGDVRQPEYRSGLCRKEFKRSSPAMPETTASMGRLECVTFFLSKARCGSLGQVVRRHGRSSSWMLPGHIVRRTRPVRWRSSYRQRSR